MAGEGGAPGTEDWQVALQLSAELLVDESKRRLNAEQALAASEMALQRSEARVAELESKLYRMQEEGGVGESPPPLPAAQRIQQRHDAAAFERPLPPSLASARVRPPRQTVSTRISATPVVRHAYGGGYSGGTPPARNGSMYHSEFAATTPNAGGASLMSPLSTGSGGNSGDSRGGSPTAGMQVKSVSACTLDELLDVANGWSLAAKQAVQLGFSPPSSPRGRILAEMRAANMDVLAGSAARGVVVAGGYGRAWPMATSSSVSNASTLVPTLSPSSSYGGSPAPTEFADRGSGGEGANERGSGQYSRAAYGSPHVV